jgi:4,5-dihydroxyphthalate decarboxylase
MDKPLPLTVATGDYAHTRALTPGGTLEAGGERFAVQHEIDLPVRIFAQALGPDAPFDVAEMSLATAHVLADRRDGRFVALPVFPSRMFRHSAFYVAPHIERPAQLAGGRIGVVRYGMTAAVWARELLHEAYGIAPVQLTWWIGEPQFFQPRGVTLNTAAGPEALERMLVAGELDCLFSVDEPAAFRAGLVRRLFPDFAAAERERYRRTGIFPIMHTVLLRRALAGAHPDLPAALLAAFQRAKLNALDWILDTDHSSLPVPFQHGWAREAVQRFGGDPWPYGLAANGSVLERFAAQMHAQGLTERRVRSEELFLPLEP